MAIAMLPTRCSLAVAAAPQRSVWLLPALALALPLAVGCQGDNLHRPKTISDEAIYWDLELNHHAVTLSSSAAGYDTLTIVAIPRNAFGELLAELPAPQYTSSDPEHVVVTTDGILQAVSPTSLPVAVAASLTYNNLKHVDTAWVAVVDEPNPPILETLSIHPLPPDSAKLAATREIGGAGSAGGTGFFRDTLPVRATAVGGVVLPAPLVYFRSVDTTIVTFNGATASGVPKAVTGDVYAHRPGVTQIYASTTLFGVTKVDTVLYRVGAPIEAQVFLHAGAVTTDPKEAVAKSKVYGFFPSGVTVAVGGVVLWANPRPPVDNEGIIPIDIVFDDADVANVGAIGDSPFWTTQKIFFGFATYKEIFCDGFLTFGDCGSGNILTNAATQGVGVRIFPVAGTYRFHSVATGASGHVTVVLDEH